MGKTKRNGRVDSRQKHSYTKIYQNMKTVLYMKFYNWSKEYPYTVAIGNMKFKDLDDANAWIEKNPMVEVIID